MLQDKTHVVCLLQAMSSFVRLKERGNTGQECGLVLPDVIFRRGAPQVDPVTVGGSGKRNEFVLHDVFYLVRIVIQENRQG